MNAIGLLRIAGVQEIILILVLLVAAIVIILLLKALIGLILPIAAALVAWFLTHNLLYAGIAFIALAILQLLLRR